MKLSRPLLLRADQAICTFSKLLTFVIMCTRWILSKWIIKLLLLCMSEFEDGNKCKWCWISTIAQVILVPVWIFSWKLWLPETQQMAIFGSGPLTYLVFEIMCLHSSEELHSLGLCYHAASQICVHRPHTPCGATKLPSSQQQWLLSSCCMEVQDVKSKPCHWSRAGQIQAKGVLCWN